MLTVKEGTTGEITFENFEVEGSEPGMKLFRGRYRDTLLRVDGTVPVANTLLVGASGSGKSTFLEAMKALDQAPARTYKPRGKLAAYRSLSFALSLTGLHEQASNTVILPQYTLQNRDLTRALSGSVSIPPNLRMTLFDENHKDNHSTNHMSATMQSANGTATVAQGEFKIPRGYMLPCELRYKTNERFMWFSEGEYVFGGTREELNTLMFEPDGLDLLSKHTLTDSQRNAVAAYRSSFNRLYPSNDRQSVQQLRRLLEEMRSANTFGEKRPTKPLD